MIHTSTRGRQWKLVAAAMLVVALLAAAPAPPALADQRSDARAMELLEKAYAGTLTQSETDELVASFPEVAAIAPAPEPEQVTYKAESVPPPSGSTQALGTSCKSGSGTYHHKSLLGFTIYKFKAYSSFCYNGTKVTSVYNQRHSFYDTDGTVTLRRISSQWKSGVGTATAYAFMQGEVEHCVIKYGCFATTYPWVKLKMTKSGGMTYTKGK